MSRISKVNAMSVDVEDYFQVSAFESHVDRADWDGRECRVEANVERILSMFDQADTRATFFTLGWMAQRYPGMIRKIVDQGHELASHGWEHVRVTQQNRAQFTKDVTRTKALLEDTGGVEVKGYRAASYSIGAGNLWALEVLRDTGHRYSSSIFPINHDLYGMPDAPRFAFHPCDDAFVEFPVTTVRLGGRNLPCSGGGWFRLLPYPLTRLALQRVNDHDGQASIFYFHPWEIDPEQPRQPGLPLKTRFRHYLNLNRMEKRLQQLLKDFQWGRMDEVLLAPMQEQQP